MRYADIPGGRRERRDVSLRCLVHRARNGSQPAWNELVSRHAGLVWSVTRAHRLSESDAADVSQATWLRLVEHLGSIRDPDALAAWLATTARRESLRVLRRSARTVACAETPETADDAPELDNGLLITERDGELWDAFGRLRRATRRCCGCSRASRPRATRRSPRRSTCRSGSIGPTRARALERLRREMDVLAA